MATAGAEAAADSTDSDDSMSGEHPTFSDEESTGEFAAKLLKNSNAFVRLYEENHLDLQQLINELNLNSEGFLEKYGNAAQNKVDGMKSIGWGFLCVPIMLGGSFTDVVEGGVKVYESEKHKAEEEKKIRNELEKALKTFSVTVDKISKHLRKICTHVEKLLEYQKGEQSSELKHQIGKIREAAEDLSELAEHFKSKDLKRLLRQAMSTIDMSKEISPEVSILFLIFDFLFTFEDYQTLRDIDKLKNQRTVPEDELESKAGKFICKLRNITDHLQNTLNEMEHSKTEVEGVLIPSLNQFLNLQK